MKRIFVFLMMAMFAIAMTSCKSCSKTEQSLNFDEIIKADYDYVASQYSPFHFYEADVEYDTIYSVEGAKIASIRTVFQIVDEPTDEAKVMFITHTLDGTDTLVEHGYWLECMDMSAYNAVSYDSMLNIIKPYRDTLNTRFMTFRRVLAPPFPTNGQYIWGPGMLVVDGATGEIVDWNDDNWTEGCLEEAIPYDAAEVKPEFVGGEESMIAFIQENLKYPEDAPEDRVLVRFIIREDGTITNIEALHSSNAMLSEAAMEVVKNMPAWNPGKIDGASVAVIYTLPIIFKK